ncbi:hypothetical protein C9374_010243 [Naegleria lovaniensis]|uniref:N-acetyltransferase domain-containing protein n=1 Tax=Naegleria lovaniensis TaxID=51637 RepID=A0AA88KFX9_NAELO|nr:uncharacterized protein C9374_010243 [Naegleria lovaniensis]KAG2374869.1 hypothetical protein C9374_010243 [Naegleria lovaniensis]
MTQKIVSNEDCFIQAVNISDHLDLIYSYEKESYPEDEAATYEKLKYRLLHANDVFRGYFRMDTLDRPHVGSQDTTQQTTNMTDLNPSKPVQLIGFVCGTKTSHSTLTHDSMSVNDPNGRTLCIHSVVIKKEFRNCGLGLHMLQLYLNYLRENHICDQVLLITKKHLIHFYEKAGFKLNGESNVVHGQEKWYECELLLI